MAIRSKEFVGIAEGLKSHELSMKGKIEGLKGTISELSEVKRSLDSRVLYLEAALAAAYEDTDEDGDPDYGRIAAIEAQISSAERELSEVEWQLDTANGELSQSQAELESVLEEKDRTLFEIQERARKTSQNISIAGGMFGAYSGVGSSLQSSMQTSLTSLSQAASILDGSVDGFTGGDSGGGEGGGLTSGRGMTSQGELSTSALSAFAVGATTSSMLGGNMSPASTPSSFTTSHTNEVTPATTSGFHSAQQSINPQKTLNFKSEQSGNLYAVSAFSMTETSEQQTNQASKFQSSQQSGDFSSPFNPFSHWFQSKKTANTTIAEFSGLSIDKNGLCGDRYFIKGNNYEAFCESRKNINQYKQVNCNETRTISAKDIEGIYLNDSEAKDSHFFWNRGMKYEMDSESFFMKTASYIPEFQARMKNGESVESIITDSNLRTCYELYFQKPIEVYEVDGFYEFAGSGRHRCMAAQKLGIDIPVRIVARFERKDIPSTPPRNIFSGDSPPNDLSVEGISKSVSSEATLISDSSPTFSSDNNQIAAAMMIDGLVRKADFGKLDNRTVQDIQKSVSETLEMFPDIDLRFVGSVQARNQHIGKSLETMYLDAYRRYYPAASDEDLMPFVRQQVAEDMNGLEPGNGTIAQSLFVATPQTSDEDIIAKFNGISINEQYGGDYNYFTHIRRSDVEAKWKPAGCDTPRATVDHELGHQIARLTNAHNDAVIQEMYSDFMSLNSTQRGEALSGYAGKSIHEFIAEGWSEYRNNPNCRALATNISNRLFELYNQCIPRLVKVRR